MKYINIKYVSKNKTINQKRKVHVTNELMNDNEFRSNYLVNTAVVVVIEVNMGACFVGQPRGPNSGPFYTHACEVVVEVPFDNYLVRPFRLLCHLAERFREPWVDGPGEWRSDRGGLWKRYLCGRRTCSNGCLGDWCLVVVGIEELLIEPCCCCWWMFVSDCLRAVAASEGSAGL